MTAIHIILHDISCFFGIRFHNPQLDATQSVGIEPIDPNRILIVEKAPDSRCLKRGLSKTG